MRKKILGEILLLMEEIYETKKNLMDWNRNRCIRQNRKLSKYFFGISVMKISYKNVSIMNDRMKDIKHRYEKIHTS